MRTFALLLLLASCAQDAPEEPTQPVAAELTVPDVDSVILITVDTLRADYLGIHGGPARTPVMDKLASRSWNFDNCISASMLTNPSHASIMTSLYPKDHGVQDNSSGIADGVRTLAMAMQRQGFTTAALINFPHLNPEVSNLGQGFGQIVRATRDERSAVQMSNQALSMLDNLGVNERYFMWLHYTDPHSPYEPSSEFSARPWVGKKTPMAAAKKAAPGFLRKSPWFAKAFERVPTVEAMVQKYVAEIENADRGIGILLDGLTSRGLRPAIVLTSDHGENMGEHGLYFHHGGLYRSTVHVPLIVHVPGAAPVRIPGQVASVDIAATILDLVGAPRWEPMRGRSLTPVVLGHKPARDLVFSEHMLAQQVSVRSLDGTLILHRKPSRQFPTYPFVAGMKEVYDVHVDAGEEHDLGGGSPLGAILGTALDGYLEAGLHLAARAPAEQDRESLRTLGYVE